MIFIMIIGGIFGFFISKGVLKLNDTESIKKHLDLLSSSPEYQQIYKLISDDIITPHKAVFDYSTTVTAPVDLTIDGAIDGLAHSLEIYYGIDSSSENYDKINKQGG